jgi:hypothetical protein
MGKLVMYKYAGVIERKAKKDEIFYLESLCDRKEDVKVKDCRLFPFSRIVKVKLEEVDDE